MADGSSSIGKARIEAERDSADILECLIRREQLHERTRPHVPVKPRKRVRVQVTGSPRSSQSTIGDFYCFSVDEPLGALEVFHQRVKFGNRRRSGQVLVKESIGGCRGPAQHGPGGREIDFNLRDQVLYRWAFGLRAAS